MEKVIGSLRDHVVVCGTDEAGEQALAELRTTGTPVVLVCNNREFIELLQARFGEVRDMFLRIRKELGVPLEIVNDGEVTALAGSISLGDNGVLGLALGSWLGGRRADRIRRPVLAYGLLGPTARASGVETDVRRDEPYAAYPELEFDVVVRPEGDVFAKAVVRLLEILQSTRILRQAMDRLPGGNRCLATLASPRDREDDRLPEISRE